MKREKTSSASFSLEDITATVTFLSGLVTQSSSFEPSEGTSLDLLEPHPTAPGLRGTSEGHHPPSSALGHPTAEQIMRPDKDMVEPLKSPVGDSMSPGLNEG